MKKKLIEDKANCTYWWIIHLDTRNGVHKLPTLTGYSKFMNESEANDKINCLMSKIDMLNRNGWLSKSNYIQIFKKLGALPNKQEDRLILILKPNDYLIPTELLLKIPFELKTFLNKFYQCIGKGEQTKQLLPVRNKEFSKDSLFDLSKHHFTKIKDLYDWCEKQISNGEARDMVLKFYHNYSRKHLSQ